MKFHPPVRKSLIPLLLAFALALVLVPVYAQQEETGAAPAIWKESTVQFPAAPQKENLLSFFASNANVLNFTIDAKSVSVENDGVIRYTLVITSKNGAANISYEGIRCSTGEKKLYAFGQTDGSWSAAKRDTWDPIYGGGVNRQHITLAKEYFCDESRVAGKAETIVERIRRKKPLK